MDCMLISDVMDSHVILSGGWHDSKGFGKRKYWFQEDTSAVIKMRKHTFDPPQMNSWEQVDDLAADLDGSCSLSNLSVDLGPSSFANSEGLLSLPSLSCFKQELLSPFHTNDLNDTKNGQIPTNQEKTNYEQGMEFSGPLVDSPGAQQEEEMGQASPVQPVSPQTPFSPPLEDCRFQYVLGAATSIATKVNEETLTYLNQGQSYEIKVKKLGDLSECRGKILKSVVRLCFHERRLQYMEREQLLAWEAMHPGDSILEVDLPLSYGIVDVSQDPKCRNSVDFLWDPTKEVAVFIKVNCISTEFTPKKHGGEKGVPFRVQVDTYLHSDPTRKLHSASCQVKVFKLKGADRKHKQDREKILKRPLIEQEKYQSSCDCTILTDVPINGDLDFSPPPLPAVAPQAVINNDLHKLRLLPSNVVPKEETAVVQQSGLFNPPDGQGVRASWSVEETSAWLASHRYGAHLTTLASYSGADLLRLTRDQLVQLCGLSDGLRLHNALRSPGPPPARTLYASPDGGRLHRPLYLSAPTAPELGAKLAAALSLATPPSPILIAGPAGIRVLVNDELVSHIPDHSAFDVQLSQGETGDGSVQALLIPSNCQIT